MTRENTHHRYRTFSAMPCMLVGIGLVRYTYSPLLPSMLDHHWITPSQEAIRERSILPEIRQVPRPAPLWSGSLGRFPFVGPPFCWAS